MPLVGFWTEHDKNQIDAPPHTSEISGLVPGCLLTPVTDEYEYSTFVLRGVYDTFYEAVAARERLHVLGWEDWLVEWKRDHPRATT